MSAPELAVVRESAMAARADAFEVLVGQQAQHAAEVAGFARRLAESVADMGTLPAATAQSLLMAVSTFAAQGGPKP